VPPLNCRASGFVQSRSKAQLSGKFDYASSPFLDSQSMPWEFFTDDYQVTPWATTFEFCPP
jgi:hypothetical protein